MWTIINHRQYLEYKEKLNPSSCQVITRWNDNPNQDTKLIARSLKNKHKVTPGEYKDKLVIEAPWRYYIEVDTLEKIKSGENPEPQLSVAKVGTV